MEENETPAAPAETPPAAPAVAEVAQHVEQAATGATAAAKGTGDEGWATVAEELKGLRGDIRELIEQGKKPAVPEKKKEAPAQAAEPVVAAPEKQYKYVLRNGRRVRREVS